MKRVYETPIAYEEAFAANDYIAKCSMQITSTSGNNRMQCANPKHSEFMNGSYFTSVWVEATNSTCSIKVDKSGIGRTEVLGGNNAQPAPGAVVYGATGTQYYCNSTYRKGGVTYNVQSMVNTEHGGGACYGTYVNTGDYSEIMKQVYS